MLLLRLVSPCACVLFPDGPRASWGPVPTQPGTGLWPTWALGWGGSTMSGKTGLWPPGRAHAPRTYLTLRLDRHLAGSSLWTGLIPAWGVLLRGWQSNEPQRCLRPDPRNLWACRGVFAGVVKSDGDGGSPRAQVLAGLTGGQVRQERRWGRRRRGIRRRLGAAVLPREGGGENTAPHRASSGAAPRRRARLLSSCSGSQCARLQVTRVHVHGCLLWPPRASRHRRAVPVPPPGGAN